MNIATSLVIGGTDSVCEAECIATRFAAEPVAESFQDHFFANSFVLLTNGTEALAHEVHFVLQPLVQLFANFRTINLNNSFKFSHLNDTLSFLNKKTA